MLGLTLQIPAHPDDAVVIEVQAAQAGQLGEALQDEDCVVGEVYAVKLVLQHTGEGGITPVAAHRETKAFNILLPFISEET